MKRVFNKKVYTFILIGVLNTLINVFILLVLVDNFGIEIILANTLAFIVANIFSYFTNSFYTFKHSYSIKKYFKFFNSSIFFLIFSNIIFIITEWIQIHYYYGVLFNIIVIPALSYIVMNKLIFKGN